MARPVEWAPVLLVLTAAPLCAAAHVIAAERSFEVRLENGKAVGQRTLRATQGDSVRIVWHSDRDAALHLHGYDIQIAARPGEPAVMRFEALATGRFPVELHGADGRHRPILFIEVHPR